MKKHTKYILPIILVMILLCLCACGAEGTVEYYEAYEITQVKIVQGSGNTLNFKVKSEIPATESTKIYITLSDTIKSNDKEITPTINGDELEFQAEISYSRFNIHVVDGKMSARISVLKPILNIESENGTINYKFANEKDAKSYYNPMCKGFYRSKVGKFDSSAESISKSIQTGNGYTLSDGNPNANMPYYYLEFGSKSGIVEFVSAPIVEYKNLLENLSAKIEIDGGKPKLIISGKFRIDGDSKIEIYSSDSRLPEVVRLRSRCTEGKSGENFTLELDFSEIIIQEGSGIWFDIKLVTSSGTSYELSPQIADMSAKVSYNGITIDFQSWNNHLKLCYTY